MTRLFRLWAQILILVLIASCTGSSSTRQVPEIGAGRTASDFQRQLDALGIPLDLPPGRAILVNIPAYELLAFEEGTPVLRSRVIVGKPTTRTPRVDTYTTRVIFRPSWFPTREMVASGEVTPGIRPPGPNNPMGLAAIGLEPGMEVFLHDTNEKRLFAREQRAFSHGCIRVERWEALVAWILERDEAWVRAMAENPPTKAFATPHIPVLIRYLTAFPTAEGNLNHYGDIYEFGENRSALKTFGKDLRTGCKLVPGGPLEAIASE